MQKTAEGATGTEKLGPQARLREELTQLESQNRDFWVVVAFAAGVLLLGFLSLVVPHSFWSASDLSVAFWVAPQVLFVIMMGLLLISLYLVRREMEVRKLRLLNLHQLFEAQSEFAASMIDSVTHVFNRNFLRELLQSEISRTERNKRPLCLVMVDINNFKQVNDRYGHLMGDYVLAEMARIFRSCVRGSDYIVRYGGDEFLLILPETDETGSGIVKSRIQQRVVEWDQSNRVGDLPISLSIGVTLHKEGQALEQTVADADARMYADKPTGSTAATRSQ